MSRELDAKVAEKVFGLHSNIDSLYWFDSLGAVVYTRFDYRPTSDVRRDFEVLKHVRETWPRNELEIDTFDLFLRELEKMWQDRSIMAPGYGTGHALVRLYEPGDYSRAALKALREEV